MVAWALYAVGWTLGWLLLWSNRRLPPARSDRPALAVVVPARDEAEALPHLLAPLLRQLHPGDDLVVVDDQSTDATTDVAAAHGARVVAAPALPTGWIGKPHACWVGAGATIAPVLVFLDADVRPGADLLDGLAAEVCDDVVVSVQPSQDAPGPTALASVVTMMGSGGFTVLGERLPASVAFGPVLTMTRATYDRAGGHAHPDVRASLTEDIALARLVGRSRIASDRHDASMRGQGWSRTMTAGVGATRSVARGRRRGVGVVARRWPVRRLAGIPAERAAGLDSGTAGRPRVGPVTAACYPVLVIVLVGIVVAAAGNRLRGVTTWKGRSVRAA